MATTRAVILQFGDRKKAISIPEVSTPDIEFLKGALQQWTGESAEPHFQRLTRNGKNGWRWMKILNWETENEFRLCSPVPELPMSLFW